MRYWTTKDDTLDKLEKRGLIEWRTDTAAHGQVPVEKPSQKHLNNQDTGWTVATRLWIISYQLCGIRMKIRSGVTGLLRTLRRIVMRDYSQ